MHNARCTFTLTNGDSCYLSASIRVTATQGSAVDTADYCTLHSRVVSAHVRAHMPNRWTRLTETLLSAVDLLPVPTH